MMNSTQPIESGNGGRVGQAALPGNGGVLRGECGTEKPASLPRLRPKRALYGLPCAECKTYYAADQMECPVCRATERVSPNAASAAKDVEVSAPEYCGDDAALAAERERFLREFKSQLYAQHAMRESLQQQASYGIE